MQTSASVALWHERRLPPVIRELDAITAISLNDTGLIAAVFPRQFVVGSALGVLRLDP
jgi:hypothetical protein